MTPEEELRVRRELKAAVESGDVTAELRARRALSTQPAQPAPSTGELGKPTDLIFGGASGMASLLGTPVDLLSGLVNQIPGVYSPKPYGGSQWLRENVFGGAQTPDTVLGKIGEVGIPAVVGGVGLAPRVAAATGVNPARLMAAEATAGVGAGLGAGGAEFLAPGNQWAQTGGAVAGGMIPGALSATTRVAQNILDNLGPERRASRVLADALPPEDAARAELARLGDDAVLADVSTGATRALEGAYNRPQAGGMYDAVGDTLAARSREQGEALLETLGDRRFREMAERFATQRRSDVRPMYEAAYQTRPNLTDEFVEWFRTPGVQRIWRSRALREDAEDIASLERLPYSPEMFEADLPSTQGIDYLLRHMRNRAKSLVVRDPGKASTAQGLFSQGREMLEEVSPKLAAARRVFAGVAESEDLLKEGADRFLKGNTRDVVDKLNNMSKSQLEIYRAGALEALQEAMDRKGDTHDVTTIFRKPSSRKRMEALFRDPKEFKRFEEAVEASARKQRTFSQVTGNSATARRTQEDDDTLLGVVLESLPVPTSVGRLGRAGRALDPWRRRRDELVSQTLMGRDYPAILPPQRGPITLPTVAPTLGPIIPWRNPGDQ